MTSAEPAPGYDARQVATAARMQDPGLPPESAELLARQAGALLTEAGVMDAPELARRLLADNRDLGASAVNVVAVAAVASAARPVDVAPGAR